MSYMRRLQQYIVRGFGQLGLLSLSKFLFFAAWWPANKHITRMPAGCRRYWAGTSATMPEDDLLLRSRLSFCAIDVAAAPLAGSALNMLPRAAKLLRDTSI